jgi:hypothetical protein
LHEKIVISTNSSALSFAYGQILKFITSDDSSPVYPSMHEYKKQLFLFYVSNKTHDSRSEQFTRPYSVGTFTLYFLQACWCTERPTKHNLQNLIKNILSIFISRKSDDKRKVGSKRTGKNSHSESHITL